MNIGNTAETNPVNGILAYPLAGDCWDPDHRCKRRSRNI